MNRYIWYPINTSTHSLKIAKLLNKGFSKGIQYKMYTRSTNPIKVNGTSYKAAYLSKKFMMIANSSLRYRLNIVK